METDDISNEEGDTLLSEKIVTRKQSKADSVARKSNVNSDENVNQLAEVLKNQDTRSRQIANHQVYGRNFRRKTYVLGHESVQRCKIPQRIYPYRANIVLRIFNTQISVGSKHLSRKKKA